MPYDQPGQDPEPAIRAYIASICPQLTLSLVGAQVDPALPFGDLYPNMQDWILDDIIAWIAWEWDQISNSFSNVLNQINTALDNAANWIVDRISPIVNNLWGLIKPYMDWIGDLINEVWSKLWSIGTDIIAQISPSLQGIGSYIVNNIIPFFQQLPGQIGNLSQNVWSWLCTKTQEIISTIGPWIQNLGPTISSMLDTWWQHIVEWFNSMTATFNQWMANLLPSFDNLVKLINFIPDAVLKGIQDLGKSLLKVATDWLQKDAHDSLVAINKDLPYPYKEVHSGFLEDFWKGLGGMLQLGTKNFMDNFTIVTAGSSELIPEWSITLFKGIEYLMSLPFQALEALLKMVGTVSPEPGNNIMGIVGASATVTVAGLSVMMLMGELVGFFKHVGMGYISAMIYDISNFKELTGAYVRIIAQTYITKPVQYWYNSLARPNLPGIGDLMAMCTHYAFTGTRSAVSVDLAGGALEALREGNRTAFKDVIKYHGVSDTWADLLFDITDTPARYFPLRAMADAGIYDEPYFISELMNSGYNPATVGHMLDMLRKHASAELKATMLPTALKRFKEGLSDESDLKANLLVLGLPANRMDMYLFAAKLDQQTDYALDLIASYRTQYQKGMWSEADFRSALADLGLSQERIEQNVIKVQAAMFKAPKVKIVAPAVPEYLTDSGQVKVNTAKQAFRKGIATAEELYAELVKLEMPLDLADALTQYEITLKEPKVV